jgi:hypothetical protein
MADKGGEKWGKVLSLKVSVYLRCLYFEVMFTENNVYHMYGCTSDASKQ